jgi:hypothetical protein
MYRASTDPKNAKVVARIVARHQKEAIVVREYKIVKPR